MSFWKHLSTCLLRAESQFFPLARVDLSSISSKTLTVADEPHRDSHTSSDDHSSVVSFPSQTAVVTAPGEVALADVRKEVRFWGHAGVRTAAGGLAGLCESSELLGRLGAGLALVAGSSTPLPG
jgi:hypothetical protein